jgi:tetratricopeptide (TPR) repeat protein
LSDPLLRQIPPEDQGARTAGWYDFQYHCALRLLLALLVNEESGGVILETHEDVLLMNPHGKVKEAVSVKHRDQEQPWTMTSIIKQGGLGHLFATWRSADRGIGVRLMTNAALASGKNGARRLMEFAETDEEERKELLADLAGKLQCDPEEAADFLESVTLEPSLPHRWYVEHAQIARFLMPVLRRHRLPLGRREQAYEAALQLLAVRSKDRDPLDEEARLVALRGVERLNEEREAQLRARTVSTDHLLRVLSEAMAASAGETKHVEAHPFLLPKAEIRRTEEMRKVAEKITHPETRLVALLGVGGEGKSTVAKQYVVSEAEESFETTFSFSFRAGSPELFFKEAFRVFPPKDGHMAEGDPFQQARQLAESLCKRRALVVLHEFECVLGGKDGSGLGRLESRDLKEFLALLLSAPHCQSKVLATSRIFPVEFKEVQGFVYHKIRPYGSKEIVEYLRKRGISGSDAHLEAAGERFFGHALTIAALADFLLRSEWRGSVKGVESFQSLPPDREGRTRAVLDSYRELLSDAARDVVLVTGASTEGLSRRSLAAVCESIGVDGEALEEVLESLADSALLRYELGVVGAVIDTHSLIAEYFLEHEDDQRVEEIRRALQQHYVSLMPPGCAESLEEARPGIAAFMQAVACEDWETATELYFSRLPVPRELFWSGHYRVCRQLTDPLLAAWKTGRHGLHPDHRAGLLANLGRVEAKMGDVDRALEAFDEAAAEAISGSRGYLRGVLYGIEVALEGARCWLARERLYAARSNGHFDMSDYRVIGRTGYLEVCVGNYDLADEFLSRAIEDGVAQWASGNEDAAGYVCLFRRVRADLLVRRGCMFEAHAEIDLALEIARGPLGFRDYEGHLCRTRGDAYYRARGIEKARVEYGQALEIARDSGYAWLKAESLVGQARLALIEGEGEEAIEISRQAKSIAEGGGWWLELGRAHVIRGEAALILGRNAAEDVSAAIEVARASGHHLLETEARQLYDDWTEGRA